MKVRCITDRLPPVSDQDIGVHTESFSLTPGREYFVLGIECDSLRILDDHFDPCLFPQEIFTFIDSKRPPDWGVEFHDGNEYAYPASLDSHGFFEDFHDKNPEAISRFSAYINKLLCAAKFQE